MDGIIDITMEAITTDISIAGITIGTGAGLSASMGAQGERREDRKQRREKQQRWFNEPEA